jgi:hypothetical protein
MSYPDQQEQSPFRRYWWVLAILLVICLCLGAVAGGRDALIDLLNPQVPTETATEVVITEVPGDQPTETEPSTEVTETITETPPPTETEVGVTATATKPGSNVTCRCQGSDLICSNGATTKNSPQCPTPIPPSVTPKPAACTAGWLPSSGCTCCGYDLWCADGSIGVFNPQCACNCQGTTLVCADGNSVPNSPECGGSTCACVRSDPCAPTAACPGYYDTCTGQTCVP